VMPLPTPAQRLRRPQSARSSGLGGDVSSGLTRKEAAVTEYVGGELGGKIKAIICEWWKLIGEGS